MSRTCAVRTGFFVLRDCGKPAEASCASCGRPACGDHTREEPSRRLLCLDCWGRENDDLRDDSGVYGYRRSFYAGIGYGPLYLGMGHDPFYDDFDVRSFDRHRGATVGYGDDGDYDADRDEGPASFADS
jgi:hypothetical protein